LPPELYDTLQDIARQKKVSVAWVIRDAVDKYIAEEGEVIPLFQYVQPIIYKKGLTVVAQSNGMILPQLIKPA